MISDGSGSGRRQVKKTGKHRKASKRRKAVTRTVAAGGAAVAIGVGYEVSAPIAEALSIVFHDGKGSATQVNIVEGNIFDPQLGLTGKNVSNNETIGGIALDNAVSGVGTPNQIKGVLGNLPILGMLSELWSRQIVIGNAASMTTNVNQVNVFSYNIFNPQLSAAGNTSNNLSISNAAMGMGNNTSAAGVGGLGALFLGGMAGNGNTSQLALFSGNIFNPQFSLTGANESHNRAITNAAIGNGNQSNAATSNGGLGVVGGTTGNGNTNQFAGFTSNIFNPQFNLGGTNASNNTANTNTAGDNGNDSNNEVSSGSGNNVILGTNGNGNANQASTGTGNIFNDQFRFGFGTPGTTGGTPAPGSEIATRIKTAVDKVLKGNRNETSDNNQPAAGGTNDAAQ
jgi:hypothetical protein